MNKEWKFAGFWKRLCAYWIDSFLLGLVAYVIQLSLFRMFRFTHIGFWDYIGNNEMMSWSYELTSTFILLLFYFSYFGWMTSSKYQATLGKLACGIKVVGVDGGRISLGRSLGRYAGYILNAFTFNIGFLIIAFSKEKRGLHDRICKTYVITKR